jgi:neuronal calcium sensor 1
MYVASVLLSRTFQLIVLLLGAFQLYDIDGDGTITYAEILQILQSIYKMTGSMISLPLDEDTPEKVRLSLHPSQSLAPIILSL